ncbi:succinate dehydrogenase, hydrophobic membrane anchor protein [Novosphingobium sp. ZN18A2]|uniref:succinate dehydrogenase, hydrophobic membrane anchor protein n=1 Tax=Novosphingobium sp. ZN18A2 TaxID=3079861 RepID=UPI0030D4E60D
MGNGTSIGRVRGLGSSHQGPHHWLVQRFTAIGNIVLVVWFLASLLMMPSYDFQTMHAWLSRPVPATAMILLIVSTFWHARLGLQVFAEDYVHEDGSKILVLALLNTIPLAGAVFGIVSVIRIALGGA